MLNDIIKTVDRRLVAIVCVDVCDYTRLTEIDEAATHKALNYYRTDVIDPAISLHQGKLVKNTGDGFIAEFSSVINAMRFAMDFQDKVAERNSNLPPEQQILKFRTGINSGDVIDDHDDIYGEGVNIAVRLQEIAEPDGIYVSEAVYAQVKNKLSANFDDLGWRKVKNLTDRIHAYRVVSENARFGERLKKRLISLQRPVLWTVLALIVMIGAASIWWQISSTSQTTDSTEVDTGIRPKFDNPAIMVLPFKNIGGDTAQEYFIDGITFDMIGDLSRFSGLTVISGQTSFEYKNKSVNMRKIADDLGISHMLTGNVRKVGDELRINVALINARTGEQLWAARYEKSIENLFKTQDEIAASVISALLIRLTPKELRSESTTGTKNTKAYDSYLRGWEYYRRRTLSGLKQALPFFKTAIKLDPKYADAHAAMASIYLIAGSRPWNKQLGLASRYHARDAARASLKKAMKRPNSLALRVTAEFFLDEGRHEEALIEIERAFTLDPNDAENLALYSIALTWAGRPNQGISTIRKAMQLNPHYPPWYQAYLGVAKYSLDDFEGAASHLRRAFDRGPDQTIALAHLIAALGQMNRGNEVEIPLTKFNQLRKEGGKSPFSLVTARAATPYKFDKDFDRLIAGLKLANVPEWVPPK